MAAIILRPFCILFAISCGGATAELSPSQLKFPFGNNSDIDRNTYHVVRRKYFGNIWLAESYIENELRSHIHDSSMSNRFVWLLSNGTVVYSMSFASNAARLFLPSIFIVLVGWLSFWIERSEVSSRVKLGTLCLLAMITEQVGTKLLLPVEFNISSVEVWFVMSLTFVVVAMFEYTFVHAVDIFQEKVKRQEEMKKKIRTQTGGIGDTQDIKQRSNVDLIDMNTLSSDGSASGETTGNRNDDLMNTFGAKYIMMVPTGVVEKYFRILYPVAYLFFQFLFWTIYLNYEEVYE
ncbi:Gamma-aminobutyric acid receptor subunit rho-1 [Mizuhopecten yessoensis]|uniref:Gamma-aminobutyric acid receptor subunit rho-1 n=1 Tax=Mizuhopecten yessoensis TaxID=6573 RepID=A0A210QUH2_MIZYE|nr:Gamma-aminobutyric acid receptor subunit rho-1 [Mizuhopecten yessoensis]